MTPQQSPTAELASKALLDQLRTGAGVQRLASLDRLEQACDALAGSGQPIDAAKAGRQCAASFKKGPNAQSIRNDSGGFKAYVDLRREEQATAAAASGKTKPRRSPLADSIEALQDADTRARLRILLEENAGMRRDKTLVAAALAELQPGLDLDLLVRRHRSGGPALLPAAAPHPVDPSDVAALARTIAVLTSPDALRPHGLEYDGKRVRRIASPYTEFLAARVVSGLVALHDTLTGAQPRPGRGGETDGAARLPGPEPQV